MFQLVARSVLERETHVSDGACAVPKGVGTWIWRRFGRTNEAHCESTSGFTNASSLDLVPTRAVAKKKKKKFKVESCNHHDSPSLHGNGIVLALTWSWRVLVLINSFGKSLASFSPERQEEGFWAFDELATAFERLITIPSHGV